MTEPSIQEDLAAWRRIGEDLRAAVGAAVPSWLERIVGGVLATQQITPEGSFPQDFQAMAERTSRFVDTGLETLFAADPDEQRGTPLGVLRAALRFPSELLDAHGAVAVRRDDMARWSVPEDRYNLCPANLAELSDEAGQLGLAWGAGKAHIHLKRRRASNPDA